MPENKQTALVVEDVLTVRESLRMALEGAGLEVSCAENGREALEMLQTRSFDVLVTDMWMPEVDGLRLLKEIRGTHPEMRVFGITGGGPKLTIEAMSSLAQIWGAERVFLKPFDDDELIDAIQAAPRV
ncbi:response regulator [Mangrovibrevibacter kandeliae]|uniref:response regulator n=1 Tax=Mangrovibrevibacter kandeliae TaxID=2968473 RepID=UPI002117E4EE|nr:MULTISPECIES: response regulator [unclassified Aurantimonas]MCQ8783291.1 response regulator [Aurantimonas sp. CSK15Z-1]MCW4116194.1 response regulator [Aurantimonas sp. MSK8Z-1]